MGYMSDRESCCEPLLQGGIVSHCRLKGGTGNPRGAL